ncbi:MAG: hypothetical protein LBE13_17565, partial [Bacteroidales bacterium]|nr:hypothetical protein [Bacteroidales bacterium]
MLWLSKRKNNIEDFGAGQLPFVSGDISVLSAVSKSLSPETYKIRNIRSIPDIFSKAHLFEMSIRKGDYYGENDDFFEMYNKWVEYEWRAIIATLVLSKNLRIAISKVPFFPDIDDITIPLKFNDQGKDINDIQVLSPIEVILARKMPTCELWQKPAEQIVNNITFPRIDLDLKEFYDWKTGFIYVLTLTDNTRHPIAITSPATLVVPSIDAWHILWDNYKLSWVEPFAVDTPINHKTLNDCDPARILVEKYPDYVPLLINWLKLYRNQLKIMATPNAEIPIQAPAEQWCNKISDVVYLCGPIDGTNTGEGIIKRFEMALEKHAKKLFPLPEEIAQAFNELQVKSILAPYIKSNKSEVQIRYNNNDIKHLFIDCSHQTINNRDISKIIAIVQLSVHDLIQEY